LPNPLYRFIASSQLSPPPERPGRIHLRHLHGLLVGSLKRLAYHHEIGTHAAGIDMRAQIGRTGIRPVAMIK
jgi:hypothetical protein